MGWVREREHKNSLFQQRITLPSCGCVMEATQLRCSLRKTWECTQTKRTFGFGCLWLHGVKKNIWFLVDVFICGLDMALGFYSTLLAEYCMLTLLSKVIYSTPITGIISPGTKWSKVLCSRAQWWCFMDSHLKVWANKYSVFTTTYGRQPKSCRLHTLK